MAQSKRTYLVIGFGGKGVGDVLVCTPFIRNLAINDPDATMDVGVFGSVGLQLLRNNPYVRETHLLDMEYIRPGGKHGFRSKLEYIRRFREKRYDTAYILSTKLRHAIFAFLIGARQRVGYDSYHRGIFLTKKGVEPLEKNIAERFLHLLALDGKQVFNKGSDLFLADQEIDSAAAILNAHGVLPGDKILAIAPFGADMRRTWGVDKFWEVARYFAGRGTKVVLLGSRDDRRAIAGSPPLSPNIIDLIGTLTIRETAAVIAQTSQFLGNDSGLCHVAGAVGIKSLILGYFVTRFWYPLADCVQFISKDNCTGCDLNSCVGTSGACPPCFSAISVSEVTDRIEKSLNHG